MSPAPPGYSDSLPGWLRPLLALMILFLTVGTRAAWVGVESILVSGPILFVLGVFSQRLLPRAATGGMDDAFPISSSESEHGETADGSTASI
jgi:hypothetical protein